jgi:hypothetical protein
MFEVMTWQCFVVCCCEKLQEKVKMKVKVKVKNEGGEVFVIT